MLHVFDDTLSCVGEMTVSLGFLRSVQLIYADIQVVTGVQSIVLCVESVF